jgi:hypothetical protein
MSNISLLQSQALRAILRVHKNNIITQIFLDEFLANIACAAMRAILSPCQVFSLILGLRPLERLRIA